jgi:hypothetical protein
MKVEESGVEAGFRSDWRSRDWQVVRTFSVGTTLTANLTPADLAWLYDEQQKPGVNPVPLSCVKLRPPTDQAGLPFLDSKTSCATSMIAFYI